MSTTSALLSVDRLCATFRTEAGAIDVLNNVSFEIGRSEIVAIVGESGSGKSVTALSILGLLPKAGRVTKGVIELEGRNLTTMPPDELRNIRSAEIGMIFQDPMTSLNPTLTIGFQVAEPIMLHMGLNAEQAKARVIELLTLVGIPDPEQRYDQYPHQFSGGMRQRVMIAIGIACNPKLLIADEPTTALDVTVQEQILALLSDLTRKLGISLVIITHNLGVVARFADRVLVMYAGQLVEEGKAEDVFYRSRHLYTVGLLKSVPRLDDPPRSRLQAIEGMPPNLALPISGCRFAQRCPHQAEICRGPMTLQPTDVGGQSSCIRFRELASGAISWHSTPPTQALDEEKQPQADKVIVNAIDLTCDFPVKSGMWGKTGIMRAVDGVSFRIRPGETLGLVGESGCGKSTVARLLLRLTDPTAGRIEFEGKDITTLPQSELRDVRKRFQVVFQDPYASLNPRMRIGDIVREPLRVHNITRDDSATQWRVDQLFNQVGLRIDLQDKYPHQISGGMRQRVGIARALAMNPSFIVCDEAVSALDVSIQAQIVNLLADLQRSFGLAYLFIAHDLAVVRHISTHVMVMYLGRAVEFADRDSIYLQPLHPYTRLLLEAAPMPDPAKERARRATAVRGEAARSRNVGPGCAFHPRCPFAVDECRKAAPPLRELRPGHQVACYKAEMFL